jgi:type I restriction enzyme M protein
VYGDKAGVYCQSKIFDAEEFGYQKIVVERPLRKKIMINDETLEKYKDRLHHYNIDIDQPIIDVGGQITKRTAIMPKEDGQIAAEMDMRLHYKVMASMKQDEPYTSYNEFEKLYRKNPINTRDEYLKLAVFNDPEYSQYFWKYGYTNLLFTNKNTYEYSSYEDISAYIFETTCPEAEIVYKRGKPVADPKLRDTENVPLKEDIDEYFQREVLPYAPDAWIDKTKTKVGYEIPMTRYFYEYQAPEPVETIMARITDLERQISDSLTALFHQEG